MKKRSILFFCFVIVLANFSRAADNTETYTINDQNVEQLFLNSTDVSLMASGQQMFDSQNNQNQMFKAYYKSGSGDKTFVAAILLDFFLGTLGIHRLYLGTKTFTWVGYILTCGGIFGIVPFVDFIVLIIHSSDISPYVDNPRFFMWGGS